MTFYSEITHFAGKKHPAGLPKTGKGACGILL